VAQEPNSPGVYPDVVLDLPARDLAEARRFCETILGWEFDPRPTWPEWPSFSDGLTAGSLFSGEGSDERPLVAFRVVDIDAETSEIVTGGGSVVRPRWTLPDGSDVVVRDPSGSWLGLWRPEPAKPRGERRSDAAH